MDQVFDYFFILMAGYGSYRAVMWSFNLIGLVIFAVAGRRQDNGEKYHWVADAFTEDNFILRGIKLYAAYAMNNVYASDQALSARLGRDPRKTVSAEMGEERMQGDCKLCKIVCKILGILDKDHCLEAAVAWRNQSKDDDWSLWGRD